MHAGSFKWWGYLSVALLFFISISSCSAREPIRIGFVATLTGPNAALGVDGRDGALLAVEKINAEGGVNGRPIELLVRNDLGTAAGAMSADDDLVNQERVPVVIGHMTSNTMVAVWPEFKDRGVIFLSPTVATPQLSNQADNFFRLIPSNSASSGKLADYVSHEIELKNVAIFYDTDNSAFTDTFRDGFARNLVSNGGKVIMDYAFSSSSSPDFKSVISSLAEQDLDAICIIASAVDTALIAQQVQLQGLDVQLLTSNWALTDDLIENGGRAVDGILAVVAHNETNLSFQYADFSERFRTRFGREPTFGASYGFESVLVLMHAFQRTGGEKEGLADALLQIKDLSGLNGTISFNEYGDVVRPLYLITVRDGQFVTQNTFRVP